ncbi:hypothetical protein [Paraglaciecola sp.]|uniref:hypothetical protein n=1 Tax=Paraglaciecola sp. TaxID=1920173 RepID=UPI003EF766D7
MAACKTSNIIKTLVYASCLYLSITINAFAQNKTITIQLPESKTQSPMVLFGLEKLQTTLDKPNHLINQSNIKRIELVKDETLQEQGFNLKTKEHTLILKAPDNHGFMYGLLEIEEQLKFGTKLQAIKAQQQPYFKKRGLKFNIPLDARAPSYDDTGDSAQHNIETVWDFSFWQAYLDKMALNRYNQLTLWNPQPFTSMLKLDKYPKLALNDVYRSTAPLDARVSVWGEAGGVSPLVLNSLEKVKSISIDEKILFWKKVMSYAKSRGIDIHMITWAIYTNGIQEKYGINDEIDNPATVNFFRDAVKELVLTYPDLKGIGITAGERMPADGEVINWSREKWLWKTYGLGLADAKLQNPNRKVDFIHRFWYSGYDEIEKYWGDYPDHFSFSFKYIMARLYSSPEKSHIAKKVIPIIRQSKKNTWWNLRNDDIFVYRWGDPEYAQRFYKNIPSDISEGIHMGSDGYVWAKTFADKDVAEHNRLEIDKHWYRFMIWGRLAYNVNLSESFFTKHLGLKFPGVDPDKLYKAWQAASQIVPTVNRYQFQPGDRRFSAESSSSRETFRYVNDFQVARSMPGTGQMNARQYVKSQLTGKSLTNKVSPLELANELISNANRALGLSSEIQAKNKSANKLELQQSLDDIRAFSYLGKYYAHKITAGVWLEFFQQDSQLKQYGKKAKLEIEKALDAWKQFKVVSEKHYRPQMLARLNVLDWEKLQQEVEYEVELVDRIIAKPFDIPSSNDPNNLLSLTYDKTLNGEHRHERLQIHTPNAGEYLLEVHEENGVLINAYHNKDNGPARWEWFQDQKGVYYLNLKWKDLNKVIKVDWGTKHDK